MEEIKELIKEADKFNVKENLLEKCETLIRKITKN